MTATLELQDKDLQAARLNELGFAVNEKVEGYSLADTLKRFQAANGLDDDGKFGELTQAALFGYMGSTDSFITVMIRVASAMVGITEVPKGSNKGPQIDQLLKSVGLGPGYAWCAAFVYWCSREAARQIGIKTPVPKNAGVLNMWDLAAYKESGLTRITAAEAKADPSQIKPGMQFILDFGKRQGHTGIVESVKNGILTTIEGNTNIGLSREGIGVYRLTRRTIKSINKGFIVY